MSYPKVVICLFSGGFDSTIATYQIIKAGYIPIFCFFSNQPFTNDTTASKAKLLSVQLLKKTQYMDNILFVSIPHGQFTSAVTNSSYNKSTCISCKRQMIRVSALLGQLYDTKIVVTGEIIGEQASQTIANLRITATLAAELGILLLRPVLTYNKTEIIRLSQELGLYEEIIKPAKACTAAPRHPTLHGSIERIIKLEEEINASSLAQEAINSKTELYLSSTSLQ